MLSRFPVHRPVVLLVGAALVTGVAGCGGSSGDQGGDRSSYAKTWNDACTSLSAAQASLQTDATAATKKVSPTDVSAQAKALSAPVAKFAHSMGGALDRVKALTAPDDLKDFQSQVVKSVPVTMKVLDGLQAPLARGDVIATRAALSKLRSKDVFPAIPTTLKSQATACNVY